MGRLALKQEVSRDPSRAALADAIARVAEAKQNVDQIEAATRLAEGMLSDASAELMRASEAVEAAKSGMRDAITAAAMAGQRAPADSALRDARLREAEAQDRVAAAQDALVQISEPLASWQNALAIRTSTLNEARGIVVHEAIPDLLKASESCRREFLRYATILHFISRQNVGVNPDQHIRAWDRQAGDLYGLAHLPAFKPFLNSAGDVSQEWRAAFESLSTDPDALLPKAG